MSKVSIDFQLRGDVKNPYHCSVGAVVLNKQGQVLLIKKSDGILTLLRETLYSNESLTDCIKRGLKEEAGIEVIVSKFIGSLINYFDRVNGTRIEKTTLYFVARLQKDNFTKDPENDEILDQVLWISIDQAIDLLSKQDNEESMILSRLGKLIT